MLIIWLRLFTCIWLDNIQDDNIQNYSTPPTIHTISKLTSCSHSTLSLETCNKLVSNILDAVLEVLSVAGVPLGLVSRHCGLAREPDVKNVLAVMAGVSIEVLIREAQIGQGNGGLPDGGLAVGITPDTIELQLELATIL